MYRFRAFLVNPIYALLIGISVLLIYNVTSSRPIKINKELQVKLDNTLYMDLESGRVIIEMYNQIAPLHVKRIKELVRDGFYDGAPFHRVISRFIAQCCNRNGMIVDTNERTIPAEISKLPHVRGTVSMARSEDVNSATNQFFITMSDADFLNEKYTIWGYVVEGMELIDKLEHGDSDNNDLVRDPSIIISMSVALDHERQKLEERNTMGARNFVRRVTFR